MYRVKFNLIPIYRFIFLAMCTVNIPFVFLLVKQDKRLFVLLTLGVVYFAICLIVRFNYTKSLRHQVFITKSAFVFFDKSGKKIKFPWSDISIGKLYHGPYPVPTGKQLWIHSESQKRIIYKLDLNSSGKDGLVKSVKGNLNPDNILFQKIKELFPNDF